MAMPAVTPQADQFQYVKLPDGSYGKFNAGADDATIQSSIEKDFPGAFNRKSPVTEQDLPGSTPALRMAAAKMPPRMSAPTQFEQERNPQHHEGFLGAAGNTLKRILTPSGGVQPGGYPSMQYGEEDKGFSDDPRLDPKQIMTQAAQDADDARKAAGRSGAYRIAAGLASPFADVQGMEKAADVGDAWGVMGHAAGSAAPVIAGEAIGMAAPKVGGMIESTLGDKAPSWYRSALKPSTVPAKQMSVKGAIRTGLEEGIPVSGAGAEKLHTTIDDLNHKIQDVIDTKGEGVEINPKEVAKRTASTETAFKQQVNPDADVAAIKSAKGEYLDKHTQMRPYTKIELNPEGTEYVPMGKGVEKVIQDYPIAEAQREKTGTYTQLRKKYGQLASGSDEAQKSLARGIKEQIAEIFPEINTMNARESKLLNLDPYIERAVARISNHQKMGIGTPIAAGGVKAITGSTGLSAAAAAVKAIFDDPNLKSRLAIEMNRASKGRITPALMKARLAAYSAQPAMSANNQPVADRNTQ